MSRKRIGAPILLTLIGVLICGSIWGYYITHQESTITHQESTTEDVDLDQKYNSAYQLYKEIHLLDYPDCTQAQTLEADAKRHAQYEVDHYTHWEKTGVLTNAYLSLARRMLKIFNRRLPGFRPYYKKISFYMSEDSLEEDFNKRTENINKVASDIRKLKDQMRHREKRRLQIFDNPIQKRMDDIEERLTDLTHQEPAEPDPEHTHKHSVELYILRHRMRYPACEKHAVVEREAHLNTQWHIDMEKWQKDYDALSAEQDELMTESKRYLEKSSEAFKGLTPEGKKAMELEIENWSHAWRKRVSAVFQRRNALYERKPTQPQPNHYHY